MNWKSVSTVAWWEFIQKVKNRSRELLSVEDEFL